MRDFVTLCRKYKFKIMISNQVQSVDLELHQGMKSNIHLKKIIGN